MIIAGLQKTSTIDYPEKLSAVVFTYGCNFRCRFCHNPSIVIGKKGEYEVTSEDDFFLFLQKRKGVLEGVVITGGEPLINEDMPSFCKKIKKLGYLIKMDSNGTNPEMLKNLIEKKLIDFIAMDIKNSLDRYEETVGRKVNPEDIKKSIEIIKNSGLPYEFRTTVLPKLHTNKDFHELGKMIKGAEKFAVQGFRSQITLDKEYETADAFTKKELEEIGEIFKGYVDEVEIRDNI